MKFWLKKQKDAKLQQFIVKNALMWNVIFREDEESSFFRKVINSWQSTERCH